MLALNVRLFSDNGRKTFCIIRIVSKVPCVVLHLAFLRGCNEDVRDKVRT